MKIKALCLLTALLGGLSSTVSKAEVLPASYRSDSHIQVVTYNSNQVYRVNGLQGYTTAIELGPDENVLSVNIGDSSAWLVNVQNNIINLKPVMSNPNTNMNVVSSRGTYQFFLTAPSASDAEKGPDKNTVFLLRFKYPDLVGVSNSNEGPDLEHGHYNFNYTARGDQSIAPLSVFDDGRFTYMDFGNHRVTPAIFMVDPRGYESLVNYHVQGKYVVVEKVGAQFTLRDGDQVASIFNEDPS